MNIGDDRKNRFYELWAKGESNYNGKGGRLNEESKDLSVDVGKCGLSGVVIKYGK